MRLVQSAIERIALRLGARVDAAALQAGGFDEVIVATGITPREPSLPGIDHPMVVSYIDAILGRKPIGQRVAIMGAGGIGFDTAEFLLHEGTSPSLDQAKFFAEWGVDTAYASAGGLKPAHIEKTPRKVYLLQRKTSKVGDGLGKTTGWIHRTVLKMKAVEMVGGVNYERIADEGLLVSYGEKREDPTWIPCDTVVLCAG